MSRSYKKNQYRKSRRFDKSCRCNGSCAWCRGNRMHSTKVRILKAEDTKEPIGETENKMKDE